MPRGSSRQDRTSLAVCDLKAQRPDKVQPHRGCCTGPRNVASILGDLRPDKEDLQVTSVLLYTPAGRRSDLSRNALHAAVACLFGVCEAALQRTLSGSPLVMQDTLVVLPAGAEYCCSQAGIPGTSTVNRPVLWMV